MRVIQVKEHGGPEVLQLTTVADPEAGPGQLVLRVEAAGVNPVDTYIRAGGYGAAPSLPYTPGFDAAGVVERVGAGVTQFKEGDRVYTSATLTGAYAEKALCGIQTVYHLPANISFSQGASLGVPYATAYRALFHKAKPAAGESVLVHGASGGVGLAAVQLARGAGLIVIGTASTSEGRELVRAEGAHHVLDHKAPAFNEDLKQITDGQGADIILEMLANVNLGKDLGLLAKFGRVVVIGSRGKVEVNPRDAMVRDVTIYGMTLFNATPADLRSIHAGLRAGLENGTLRPVVGRAFPLADAGQAHKAVMETTARGKIVLTP